MNFATSTIYQKQSNGDASQGCIVYIFILALGGSCHQESEKVDYIYTHVGLSALLVSIDRSNAKAYRLWNERKHGSTLFLFYVSLKPKLLIANLGAIGKDIYGYYGQYHRPTGIWQLFPKDLLQEMRSLAPTEYEFLHEVRRTRLVGSPAAFTPASPTTSAAPSAPEGCCSATHAPYGTPSTHRT